MSELERKCPDCDTIISYSNKYSLKSANERNAKCSSCYRKVKGRGTKEKKYFRNCPTCNKEIGYTHEAACKHGDETNQQCRSCVSKIVQNRPEHKANLKEKLTGKTHEGIYKSWIKKYGKENADKMWEERCKAHSEKMSGKNNPMYGKTFYDVWEEKYDEETVQLKTSQMKEKLSIASSGENNAMFGKPSPMGSGNGWSGHYKGIYFRSLLELSYLKYLLDNKVKFENGEKRKYKIEYELDNKKLNYFPDFYLIEEEKIVEIKPKKLVNSYINKTKFNYGREKHGEKFIVLTEDDIKMIGLQNLYQLFIDKEVVFDKKYEEKFIEYYNDAIKKDD